MKKTLSRFLTSVLCLLLVVAFSACGNSVKDTDSTTEGNEKTNGWLLPTRITDSRGEFELELTWDENRCTFEAEGITISFLYDEADRSLSVSVDGKAEDSLADICIFDDKDRITAVTFEGQTVLQLTYEKENLIISAFGSNSLNSPREISADWEDHKVSMPPFDDPNDFLFFTEWGDMYAGEDTTLYAYEYDDKGNIQSIGVPDLGDYSWSITYGSSAMTKAWQRTVVKFMLVYSLGRPFATFAMDMMCFGAYQQHIGQ